MKTKYIKAHSQPNILFFIIFLYLTSFWGVNSFIRNSFRSSKKKFAIGEGFEDIFSDILEEINERELRVEGNIPNWLSGNLIRNGPSLFGTIGDKVPARKYDHIFDGLAKLHSYKISQNKVRI